MFIRKWKKYLGGDIFGWILFMIEWKGLKPTSSANNGDPLPTSLYENFSQILERK